jgi:putative membrane protein insertion efficiency factor
MSRPFAALLLALIRLYKLALSPALATLGARCRHWPTCSSYAADAVARHGAWAGTWMALARLLRCNPWGSSGVDSAPETLRPDARWWTPWRYADWRGPRPDESSHAEECRDAEAHVS